MGFSTQKILLRLWNAMIIHQNSLSRTCRMLPKQNVEGGRGVRIDPYTELKDLVLQTLSKVASFKTDLAIHFWTFPLLLAFTFN
jgi:hypothetical protein